MLFQIDEVKGFQEELKNGTIERLKEKFKDDSDLCNEKIEKYESLIAIKFDQQERVKNHIFRSFV